MENYGLDMLNIIQERVRSEENIISIFKVKNQYKYNHLLILINSNDTNAVFSYSITKWPLTSFADLSINEIFPIIRNQFKMNRDTTNSFSISSSNGQSTFNFITDDEKKYTEFANDVMQAATNVNSETKFDWLNYYRHEDLSQLNQNAMAGRKKLTEREEKFREEILRRAPEYTVNKKYRIYLATWNLNEQSPYDTLFNEWLSIGDEPPDIYAIAFQEIDMSAISLALNEARPDSNLIRRVMNALHPRAKYAPLTTVRLVGMMLLIAVKKEILKTDIKFSSESVGTGPFNMGNKGGVGVSLVINNTRICFVNSHLAAHTALVEQRKNDHDEILRRMIFHHVIQSFTINEHHITFWFGDLNYRIDEASDRIKRLIVQKDYDTLIRADQLYKQKYMNLVFQGYTEGYVNFPPTYKYNPGTDDFDSSEKARAPAWCDRVLWRGNDVDLLEYNCIMEMRLSDHKPVYAIFETKIPTIDEEKMKKVNEEILKTMDKYENDNQPQITVFETDIDFKEIHFNEHYMRELCVANNHHLPVEFSFRVKGKRNHDEHGEMLVQDNERICESWLHINPTEGTILAGQTRSIYLEIFVDSKSVSEMNKKSNTKQNDPLDILVLHVENGRDTFISIIGQYQPSCFGYSLETLVSLKNSIKESEETLNIETHQISKQNKLNVDVFNIPRELYYMIDYLFKNGVKTPHLFTIDRQFQKNIILNKIRDWLDTWSTNEYPGTPHTTAEAILMLIESTPEALLYDTEKYILENYNRFDECLHIIHTKEKVLRRSVFYYIVLFLKEIRKDYSSNKLNDEILATIFGKVLFTCFDPIRCKQFMLNVLHNDFICEKIRTHFLELY